jgi:hypothetical protein
MYKQGDIVVVTAEDTIILADYVPDHCVKLLAYDGDIIVNVDVRGFKGIWK